MKQHHQQRRRLQQQRQQHEQHDEGQAVEEQSADDQKRQRKGKQVVEELPDDDQKRQRKGKQVAEELPVDEEPFFKIYPPAFRFQPTDHELIQEYLLPKINGRDMPLHLMHDLNIYKHNPDFLTNNNKAEGDEEWYFFAPRHQRKLKGKKADRQARGGYWKYSGVTREFMLDDDQIGIRITLEYVSGLPAENAQTIWLMDEYGVKYPEKKRGKTLRMRLGYFALCKIYMNNTDTGGNNDTGCNSEFVNNSNTNVDCNTNSDISPDLSLHCASSALPQQDLSGNDAPTKSTFDLNLEYNEVEESLETIDHKNSDNSQRDD